jgi:hypothetical protein
MAMIKIFRRSTAPPPYLSVALMISLVFKRTVFMWSVPAMLSACLNRELESCAGLVVCHAGIPYQLTNVTCRMERLVLVVCVTIANKIFLVDSFRQSLYPTLHERNTLLPSHRAIAWCAKGIQTRSSIHQAKWWSSAVFVILDWVNGFQTLSMFPLLLLLSLLCFIT